MSHLAVAASAARNQTIVAGTDERPEGPGRDRPGSRTS
jgi:hypothetical protein